MDTFEAGVVLHLTENVSAALARMAIQLTRNQSAADALQARFDKISSLFKNGMVMMAGGAALASPLVAATKQAMKLESAMARVKIQTGANAEQMRGLNATFDRVSNQTGIFSKPKLAQFASEMYGGGITDINQINRLMPVFAKAADVTKLMSGGRVGAEDTLHALTAMSHQFGRYDTAGMKKISEAVVSMSLKLPGGIKSLMGVGSSVNIPANRMLGMDPVSILAFEAAVAQQSGSTGAGGKGRMSAANQVNALMRAIPGMFGAGLLSGKSAFAGAVLGLSDKYGASTVMKNGSMDFGSFQQKMANAQGMSSLALARRMQTFLPLLGKKAGDISPLVDRAISTGGAKVSQRELLAKMMTYMFGSASTVATLIGDPKFIAAQNRMKGEALAFSKNGGIEGMQEKIMNTLPAQLERLRTNMQTLASTVGTQLLPVITPMIRRIADLVDRANSFAANHPKMVQAATALLALGSGALMAGGAFNIAKAGMMGLAAMGPILTRSFGPLGLALAGIGLAADHWSDIMKFVNDHSGFFIVQASRLADVMDTLGKVAKRVGDWIGGAVKFMGDKLAGLPGLGQFAASIQKQMSAFLDPSQKDVMAAKQNLLGKGHADWIKTLEGTAGQAAVKAGQVNVNRDNLLTAIRATGGGGGKSVVHQKVEYRPTYNIDANVSDRALLEAIERAEPGIQRRTIQQLASETSRAANRSSGNSIGRPNNQRGNRRS